MKNHQFNRISCALLYYFCMLKSHMNPASSASFQSRAFIILFVFSLIAGTGNVIAQAQALKPYDYSRIGLTFSVPESWQHAGTSVTTKAAFIKQFGWTYDKPDAGDVWSAVGSFSSVAVDSTLIPSDSAYTIHHLTIFVSRSNTLYKQWLCRHRRSSLWAEKPLVRDSYTLLSSDKMGPYDLPTGLSNAYGIVYEYASQQSPLSTLGHVFSFVHQEKCFEIQLESTSALPTERLMLHRRILDTVKITPF